MIHVVAGAVIAGDGRVLIAERPPGKHLAGHWEFPGGKLEPGETRVQGLARELREELGITITNPRPLMRVRHTYEFAEVLIDLWVVGQYSGEPQGLDGQRLRWCALGDLDEAELLIADRPLQRALRLPERLTHVSTNVYLIGGRGDHRVRGCMCFSTCEALDAASDGAEFIVMGSALNAADLAGLSESLLVPLFAYGIDCDEAWRLGCSGINQIGAF